MKDQNANKIYAAEKTLWQGAKFTSRADMQAYADMVTGSPVWQRIVRNYGHVPERVKIFSLGDEHHSETRDPDEIWLTEAHWTQQAILHELAHWAFNENDHGPSFIKGYLRLLTEFMGKEVARAYRRAFRQRYCDL